MKSRNLASSPCEKVLLFTSASIKKKKILRPFPPLKSPHQSFCRAVINTAHKESPLSSQDFALSLKTAHQDPSTITYKTTKQNKNRKTRKQLLLQGP